MIRMTCLLLTALTATLIALPILLLPAVIMAADPFTVAKVPVDVTASTAIEAQTQAIATGQQIAAQQLLERLTLERERDVRGLPPLSTEVVGPLIRSLSIDNERRSATRYLGDVSIAFNPSAVQSLLRSYSLTMVRSQAEERLAVPLGIAPEGDLASDILSNRYVHSLTPVLSPTADEIAIFYNEPSTFYNEPNTFYNEPSNDQLRALAQRYNVNRLLMIRQDADGLSATDLNLGTGSQRQYRSRDGMAGIVSQIENDWKATLAVPIDQIQTSTVSVLYASMDEWRTLQRAINNSSQVRGARLDALSKDGALMTLSYSSLERLAAEMSQKGVNVDNNPRLGLVIRR